MTRANCAAFKSKTLALIDELHLSPEEVVGLGLSLAASFAVAKGITQGAVAEALTESFAAAHANLPGIVLVKGRQ